MVVGEDLGTVAAATRRALRRHAILGYRVIWFEDRAPRDYPVDVLAAVTTPDLPTVAGMWSGADLRAQRDLGTAPDAEAMPTVRGRVLAGPRVTAAATRGPLGPAPPA